MAQLFHTQLRLLSNFSVTIKDDKMESTGDNSRGAKAFLRSKLKNFHKVSMWICTI